jgi:hypothetical protein
MVHWDLVVRADAWWGQGLATASSGIRPPRGNPPCWVALHEGRWSAWPSRHRSGPQGPPSCLDSSRRRVAACRRFRGLGQIPSVERDREWDSGNRGRDAKGSGMAVSPAPGQGEFLGLVHAQEHPSASEPANHELRHQFHQDPITAKHLHHQRKSNTISAREYSGPIILVGGTPGLRLFELVLRCAFQAQITIRNSLRGVYATHWSSGISVVIEFLDTTGCRHPTFDF